MIRGLVLHSEFQRGLVLNFPETEPILSDLIWLQGNKTTTTTTSSSSSSSNITATTAPKLMSVKFSSF